MENLMNTNPAATYEGQLAARAAELLPGIGTDERLELLAVMTPDDLQTSLAWLASHAPAMFDAALVRDRAMVERLQARLDHCVAPDGSGEVKLNEEEATDWLVSLGLEREYAGRVAAWAREGECRRWEMGQAFLSYADGCWHASGPQTGGAR
jgi:hypothetical protein